MKPTQITLKGVLSKIDARAVLMLTFILALAFASLTGFAQDAAPAAPSLLDKIMSSVSAVVSWLYDHKGSIGTGLSFVMVFIAKIVSTDKASGIAGVIVTIVDKAAAILAWLISLLGILVKGLQVISELGHDLIKSDGILGKK